MDRTIAGYRATPDGDLMLCEREGVAYQADMCAGRVSYGDDYLAKVDSYDGNAIAIKVNAGRCGMLLRHLDAGATVLDIGAGSGAFVRDARAVGFRAYGYDVMPEACARMKADHTYSTPDCRFDAITLWDTVEHMEDPGELLGTFRIGVILFASVPVFRDLRKIRYSKHYRPGEHLYYWTLGGFIAWMHELGYRTLEVSEHEMYAGRDNITAVAFRKAA